MANNNNKNISILFELFNLSKESESKLKEQIYYLRLEPGEQINKFEEDIPGVFFVEEGEVRLLSLDDKKEAFTIEKFFKNQLVGAEQIIRGANNIQSIAASSNVKGILIPRNIFLDLIINKRNLLELFSSLTLSELFHAIRENEHSILLNHKELLDWSKEQLNNNLKVYLLFDSDKSFENEASSRWIVSSSNIKNFPPGSIIEAPINLELIGNLPGRLIPLPKNWPPEEAINRKISVEKNLSEDKYIDFEKSKLNLRKEAFEDRYGRLSNDNSYPQSKGKGLLNEVLACVRMLSQKFDLPFRRDLLTRVIGDQLNQSEDGQINNMQLAAICELIGLRCSILRPDSPSLIKRIPMPSIAMKDGHPIILWEQKKDTILIGDPLNGQRWIDTNKIFYEDQNNNNSVLFVEATLNSPKARFGLKWFLPAIKKHKSSLIQVVIASFFAQLLGLFNPLLIQQIIDAVISQGNLRSLNVLGTLLLAMALAQGIISSLRTFLFADTTNRMDISLGGSIIHHLLRLPMNYFSRRPVGEVSSRINELEKIRNFLTGTALTVFLDSIFSLIYIGVMLTYSVKLTFFALGVLPFFILLTLTISPIVRKQLREKAESNARVSSHLVETLSAMETVKGQNMELQSEWRWEKFYSKQIQAGFKNTITSSTAGAVSNFLQQISSLVVIWVGAIIVLEGKMSIGQLIAFRILSGYVTGPLLRLASLWQNFQETIISLERLSDIVDHKEEIEIGEVNLPPLPPVKGNITYDNVNFRFRNKGPLNLSNINFEISAGSFIGIVGSSGSGKSTLLKLLTRLFDPLEGVISIDGQDISKIDLYSLRSQVGLVPQDCILFDGTVQENIALTRPEASFEEIKVAAKVACAHDFIQEMESGYSTSVGERGSNLSGGQRQRIAIARMVLSQPKLLILDEATSALDINTEKRVTRQLAEEFRGKTVLFITHRLSSLAWVDQIMVLHKGSLVERGTHRELITLNGRYATLYKQQDST